MPRVAELVSKFGGGGQYPAARGHSPPPRYLRAESPRQSEAPSPYHPALSDPATMPELDAPSPRATYGALRAVGADNTAFGALPDVPELEVLVIDDDDNSSDSLDEDDIPALGLGTTSHPASSPVSSPLSAPAGERHPAPLPFPEQDAYDVSQPAAYACAHTQVDAASSTGWDREELGDSRDQLGSLASWEAGSASGGGSHAAGSLGSARPLWQLTRVAGAPDLSRVGDGVVEGEARRGEMAVASQSSTIRSTESSPNRVKPDGPGTSHDGERMVLSLKSKPLPKAKVLLARRRQDGSAFSEEDAEGAQMSSDGRSHPGQSDDSLTHVEPSTKKLVRNYADPMELRQGRISHIDPRKSSAAARDSRRVVDEMEPVGLGDLEYNLDPYDALNEPKMHPNSLHSVPQPGLDRQAVSAPVAAARRRANDDFLEDDLGLGVHQDDYEEGRPPKEKYKSGGLFRRKPKVDPEVEKAKRHAARQEAIQRRASVISGAVDRFSTAADPFVDFMTSANQPVKPKPGKFTDFMRRFFKGGRAFKLIKL